MAKRPSIGQVREAKHERNLNNGCLHHQKQAALVFLDQAPQFRPTVEKVNSCTRIHPCNSKWCPQCSDPKKRRKPRRIASDQRIEKGKCNLTYSEGGKFSNNYQVRAGQRMVHPFDGIPTGLLHACTINLALCSIDGNLKALVDEFRQRLRTMLIQLSVDAIARGKFDMVLKLANDLAFEIPEDELPEELQGVDMPETFYGMLHIHFVLFDPLLSKDEFRKIMVAEFQGNSRVCVKRAHQDKILKDDTVKAGAQGYLEYASLEKTEFKFGDRSKEAVLAFAKLDQTWNRANRNFSYGKPAFNESGSYDRAYIEELERNYRNIEAKQNWRNLGFAVQFLHIWMTDAKAVLCTVRDRINARKFVFNSYIRLKLSAIKRYLNSNWPHQISWFERYFIGSNNTPMSESYENAPNPVPP